MTAGQNGDRNGAARPLWVTGLSPPDSWRSLRQPGYPQLHRVRHPQRRVWGYDRKSGVSDFRLSKVCSFRLPLTSPLGASGNSARAAPRARPSWPRNKAGSSPRQRRRSRPRSSANPPANQGTRESDGADLINGLVSPFTAGRAFTGAEVVGSAAAFRRGRHQDLDAARLECRHLRPVWHSRSPRATAAGCPPSAPMRQKSETRESSSERLVKNIRRVTGRR